MTTYTYVPIEDDDESDDPEALERRYADIRAAIETTRTGDSAERLAALKQLVWYTEWLLSRSEDTLRHVREPWNYVEHYVYGPHYGAGKFIETDELLQAMGENPHRFPPVAYTAPSAEGSIIMTEARMARDMWTEDDHEQFPPG